MLNVMTPLAGANPFIPHGHCYLWQPELVGLHIFSDALIALAYYSIPLTLSYFVRRRRDLPFTWLFLLFSAFIVACGTTHLLEIWTLWHPTYWLSGSIKLLTAAISVTTAILLVPIVPKALALPSPKDIEAANQLLQDQITERQRTNLLLQASEARLAGILAIAEDAIISIDANQQISLFNQGAERIFGFMAEEVIGQPLDLLLPSGLASLHRDHVTTFSKTTNPSRKMGHRREIFGRRKDGTEFPAEASISKLHLGTEVVFTAFLRDITERKHAELALSQLAAIVESSGDAIIGTTLNSTITSWNAAAETLFGYTAAEAIGRPIALLMPPNSTNELPRILEQIQHGETIERYETVRVRKDGQRVDIAATISPIKNAAGQVIGASKIARDITTRTQAEASLRESEKRFQAFMNNSPAASWITDADGRMLYVSQTYSHLFQVSDDAINKTIFELFAPEIAEQFHRNIRQVTETQQMVEVIELAHRPDGTLGQFLVYKFPLHELAGQPCVGGIAVDMTEREQAKEQLRSLSDRLQYLLTNAPVAIFSCKAEGDYGATSMSDNIRTIMGYEPSAYLEDSGFWVRHIHPDDRDRVLTETARIFTTGTHTHEYRFLHQDGTYRWVQAGLSLLGRTEERPSEIVGYLIDVSDRKQTEFALAKYVTEVEDLYNNAPCGYHSLDADGCIIQVNDTELSWLGYTRDEVLGRSWTEFITESSQLAFRQSYPSFKQQGWVRDLEFDLRRKDGRVLPVLVSATAVTDAAGKYLYSRSTLYDVSDRKAAELALQQSEAKNQAMLAAIPDLLLRLKRDGTCLDFIPPTAPESGTFLPIEQNIAEILPAELLQHQLQRMEQALATGELQVWEQQLSKDGQTRDEEIRLVPCGDDELLLIVRDISDRKRGEEALCQSEARNRALIQAIPDLLIRMKQDGTYLDVQKTENVLLFNPSQMRTGNTIDAILPPETAQERMEYVRQALRTRELQVYEYQLNIDGELQFEEARIVPCAEDEVLVIVRDISDRKRHEAERKQAEEALRRYERIVSATTDAISLLDSNYVYQVVNQSYLEWYSKRQDEIVGHPVSDFLPTAVYETTVKPRLDQCMTGQVVQYEMWADYTALGPQFLSITYDPYYNADHTVIGVVASLRNLTRLKQAEVELELQSLIARNMAEGVCMVKVRDGLFVYANPKFERMFGYAADELIGQHVAIVNYEDRSTHTTETYETLANAILKQGEATYEVHNVKKDGTSFWCQATTSVFEHPNYGAVFVVVQQDITERKQAEDQRRDLSNRLTLALKSGAIGTWEWDVTANHLTWDDRMYELYGMTPDQFTSVYETWANRLHPDDRLVTEAAIQQALAGQKDYEPEFRVRHPDGSVHCLKAYALVKRDQAGNPQHMIGINYDITELKQSAERIEASLKEKEVLLKEIHHRVKNNLGIVDGLLQMQLRRSSDPEVIAALKESQNRIASIALVHEKLYGSEDLAKIDFAQYIADLTAHLFDSYNTYANQVKLTMQIEPISLDIDTAVPCGLIVNELVSNALKYAFPNAQAGEIQVIFQQHPNHTVTFSVGDNGIGLPHDFDLKQTKALGITLVKGLVKQLQGTLNINTYPGTTFIISFRKP